MISSRSIMSALCTAVAEEGLFQLQTKVFQVHLLEFLQPRQCELKPFCDAFGYIQL